jgi:endonuclease/exonuclease/phosphatase family metal-dependent hydrolase
MQVHGDTPFQDVDSALPPDLDPPASMTSGDFNSEPASTRYRSSRSSPEVELHRFGGSIVNSVTIHRFYGGSEDLADEDVVVLRWALIGKWDCADHANRYE